MEILFIQLSDDVYISLETFPLMVCGPGSHLIVKAKINSLIIIIIFGKFDE